MSFSLENYLWRGTSSTVRSLAVEGRAKIENDTRVDSGKKKKTPNLTTYKEMEFPPICHGKKAISPIVERNLMKNT